MSYIPKPTTRNVIEAGRLGAPLRAEREALLARWREQIRGLPSAAGLGEPDVHRGAEVELELAPRARHAGEGRDGREFPAPVIEDVAGEDVREQVLLQERVDDGRE